MNISIYDKAGEEIASVVVGSNSFVFSQIMGENYLQLEFKHGDYIDIRRDSYCVYGGVKYTLIQAVVVDKISTVEYNYTARFEAPQELLKNIIMTHMAGEGQTLTKAYERNFSLAGTAREHVEMLLRNTGRLNANFTIGTIDTSLTGVKAVAYNVVDCKSALQLIANAFETEWWVEGNETNGYTVNLGKCSFSESNPTPLAYGYDNGVLGGAKRQLHKDAQRMTHIAVQGGSRNINTLSQLPNVPAYQFSTLHLPLLVNAVDGVGTIYYDVKNNKFDGETGFVFENSVLLTIDRNANTMTSSLFTEGEDVVVERAYDLSEYYPQKTRKVTAFAFQRNNTEFYIEDSTIETACDYKAYQLGGEKITVVFQTGALAGKTFDVISYDHTNRRFECALADYDTISMPSVDVEMWRPIANSTTGGDEFIVYGTALPRSYFADTTTDPYSGAEWDMCRRTASILCENFNDKFSYSLPIDANWLSRRTEEERERLRCGFWVHFSDNQLCGGGEDIRITAVKQYLTKPLQPELTVGDEVKRVSVAQKLTQIESHVSATYNYVKTVEERTQQGLQSVEDTQSEIIDPSEDVENYKGRINVTDLLAIPVAEIGANDLYLVYSEGNEEDGWSEGQTFTIDGETYNDGTFFQYINSSWEAVEKEIDLSNYLRFNELPKAVSFIQSVFPSTSFDDLYGEGAGGGMPIARIGNYRLDENGVYQPVFVEKGTQGQQYYSKNYTKTLFVPYARRYQQGGEFHYEGGALTAADYQRLMELDSNVFLAQYGRTSHSDIKSAYNAGRVVMCVDDTRCYYLVSLATVEGSPIYERAKFVWADTDQIREILVDNRDVWTDNNKMFDIPDVLTSWNGKGDHNVLSSNFVYSLIQNFALVATSGDYNDLINKPTIPSAVTDVVKYTAQSLTDAQKTQARQNIGAGGTLTFDATPTADSQNPVTSNGIKTALDSKQNTLTFDSSPTSGSTNPVTSDGVASALNGKSDVGHTHSGYASITTVQEIVLAMNNFANKSLNNLATGAGGNIATAMSKVDTGTILEKLDAETTFVPSDTSYFVVSYGSGSAEKVRSTAVANKIASDVADAMETEYVKRMINNSILLEHMWTITSVSSSSIGWSSANVRTNAKYNLSSSGWFIAIGTGARVSNSTTQYGTVWDGNADNRINMGSGRAYVCLGHRDLSSFQSSDNFKKLIKYISSAKWLFFNEVTGKTQDILDFICPIAYVWENDAESYANCLLMVTKPMADVGIDSTVANTNSFFHLVVEGLPIVNWE